MPRKADFIGKLLIPLIWYDTKLTQSDEVPVPRKADFIGKLLIPLIWYDTKLTQSVARGPRASQG